MSFPSCKLLQLACSFDFAVNAIYPIVRDMVNIRRFSRNFYRAGRVRVLDPEMEGLELFIFLKNFLRS